MKKSMRFLSVFLCFVMLITSAPLVGFAEYADEVREVSEKERSIPSADYSVGITNDTLRMPEVSAISEPEVDGDLVEVNEYSKVYQTGVDTFQAIYSSTPNYYVDEYGKKKTYDNSLELVEKIGNDEFTNVSGDIDVRISEDISAKGIVFDYNDTKIEIMPVNGDYSKYIVKDNAIRYNDVYDGIDVQYTVSETGVKEDIIVNEFTGIDTFSYELDLNGHEVELTENTLFVYNKKTKDCAYTISAPVMTDADGNYSTDIDVSLDKNILTVTADSEWLSANERAYPVRIDPNVEKISGEKELNIKSVVQDGDRVYTASGGAYGYIGYIHGDNFGFPGVLGRSKMLVKIDNSCLASIPEGSKIISASFNIFQYVSYNSNTFWCSQVFTDWNYSNMSYTNAGKLESELLSKSAAKKGYHSFDIREAVNHWIQGTYPQYGLILTAENEAGVGGAFYTSTSGSVAGQGGFKDQYPYISIEWEVPNPVPEDYPIDQTTINLRTIIESSRDGKLAFLGIFADGVAKPEADVRYTFSDTTVENQASSVEADISYKYPDSTAWNEYFPARASKYKDILSNWQTEVPFTTPEFNKVYNYTATSTLDGITGNTVKSDDFLVYKVTRYDKLQSIANYYGVPIEQIVRDNHVHDMLLVENNTIVIINPTKNVNKPYTPGELTEKEKADIDSMLIGRALHCEFGYEPINLNTGNFYMAKSDIEIPDYNGNFGISRTYNSKSASVDSAFGRGWQFEYSERLSKLADGRIAYLKGDGGMVYFTPNADGTYTCSDGYNLDLTAIAVETKMGDFGGEELEEYYVYEYEIKNSEGEVRRFNSSGLLTKITDKKGFTTTLTYDEAMNISSVTSPAGTSYGIVCDANGHITSILVPGNGVLKYTYDENGNLVSSADELGNVTTYNYDSEHKMISWADAEDNVIITNEYDSEGRVTKQTDSEGNVTTLSYTDGQTTVTDANGNTTVHKYDSNYRTTEIVYADGTSEKKSYNASNNLASETDRSGKKTTYTYNEDGMLTESVRFDGAKQSLAYDSGNNIISFTDYNGTKEAYTYDEKGNLLTHTHKDGTVDKYDYDENCRITKYTNALGYVTEYSYDGIWVSEIIDANGAKSEYYYNSRGEVVTFVDALGNKTRYIYDAAGRNTGIQLPDGSENTFEYDRAGCMVKLTNANGYVYSYEYDGIGNITKITDPLSNVVVYEYDGLYNNISVDYGEAGKESTSYDCFSNPVTATDGEGNVTTNTYDKAGNIVTVTDANGNKTSYTYDLRFNKVSTKTDALGNDTKYEYDSVGNLIKETDALGNVTEYKYDSMNRMTEKTYPNGLVMSYEYDVLGNLVKTTSNSGEISTFVYDKIGNLISATYANGAKLEYTYDALGNVLTEKDSAGAVITYTYDALGRKTSVEDAVGRKTEYTYDNNGNILEEKVSNGGKTVHKYDALDRMREVTDALGNTTYMEYNGAGNLAVVTDALGNKVKYNYDLNGNITEQTDALGGVLKYSYDKNGNLVEAVDALGYKASIGYDALNRVASTKDALGLITEFKYDAVGNLLKQSNNNGVNNTYEYDSVGGLTKDTDSLNQATEYIYDLNGNVVKVTSYDGTTVSYTYDALNKVTSMTDAEGKTTVYSYDLVGNLLSEKDSIGRETKYAYDIVGRLIEKTDPLGQKTSYEYNEFDFVTKVVEPNGAVTTSKYDIGGNLVSETDANGNKTEYTYDKVYQLIKVAYANDTETSYSYDANGNILTLTDPSGNVTKYEYDALGNNTRITSATNAVTSYTYDAAGNILTETDAVGAVTNYIYDLESRLVSKTLANGAVYTYAYDAIGRLTANTQPEGLGVSYTYDNKGNLVSETDQSGRTTSYAYDIMHRLIGTTDAMGNATELAYDEAGNLSSFKTPNGYVTTYKYDALDRLVSSLDPAGKTENYTYDEVGNVTSLTENSTRTTSYRYDKVGNLTTVKNALGYISQKSYDSVNRLISETDFKGNKTKYTYDANGNLLSVEDREGGKETYKYDAANNVTYYEDAEGRTKEYAYDAVNRLVSVSEDGTLTAAYKYDIVGNLLSAAGYTYTYNLNGNKTSATDALGNVTEYIYNENGMLATVRNANGSTVNYDYDKIDELISKKYDESVEALYGYDKDGNRITMEDVAGTTNYEYDAMGRIVSICLANGTSKIGYEYDAFGNLAKLIYPDGTAVTYTYDKLGQLISIKNRNGDETTYEYDKNGNVTEVKRPNGTYTIIKYDDNDRVVSLVNYGPVTFGWIKIKTTKVSSYKYDYDESGNIIKETSQSEPIHSNIGFFRWIWSLITKASYTKKYDYDGRNQLVSVDETKRILIFFDKISETDYQYDIAGNRTKETVNKKTTTFSYDAAGRLSEKNGPDGKTEYTYDANGNLISETKNGKLCKSTTSYTYDNENRLEAVKENGKLLMAALYDGDGERLFVLSSHDCLLSACCDENNCSNLYCDREDANEIDVDDTLIKDAILIPNGIKKINYANYDLTGYINDINAEYTQVLMEYGTNEKITAAYEYGVFRESAEIDGNQYFYQYDGRGSVTAITSSTGRILNTYSYDAYGNASTLGACIDNPYLYNAEYVDYATNLQYLRARYYRAETGAFITADTYIGELTNPLSMNRYTYVHNNPLNGKDPSGHFLGTFLLVTAIVTVVAGGVAYGADKASQSKTRQAEEKKVERQNVDSNRTTASSNATSTAPSKSSATSMSGRSVNYKNQVYTFKTEAEAREYFSLCNTLDALDKDIVKLEKAAETWKTVGKVSSTVAMVSGAAAAVGTVVATGGAALAPLVGNLGASASVAAGFSYGVSAVAVTSTVGSTTMNVVDTWADIDNPTFNAWQKGLNITSTVSNAAYSIGNMYNSITGVSGEEYLARQKAIENGKLGYGNLAEDHPNIKIESGKDFSKTQKDLIREENMRRNNGVLRDDLTGKKGVVYNPQSGTPKPANALEVDHIIAQANGGANSFENARLINWQTNLIKSNNPNFDLSATIGGLEDVGSVVPGINYTISGNVGSFTHGNSK